MVRAKFRHPAPRKNLSRQKLGTASSVCRAGGVAPGPLSTVPADQSGHPFFKIMYSFFIGSTPAAAVNKMPAAKPATSQLVAGSSTANKAKWLNALIG